MSSGSGARVRLVAGGRLATVATSPLSASTPTMFGNTCSAFIRSPQAHTRSTRVTAPIGISRQYTHRYGMTIRRPKKIDEELLAVIRPADQRGVPEQEDAHRDHPAADARQRSVERKRDGGRARLAREIRTCEKDRQCGNARGDE